MPPPKSKSKSSKRQHGKEQQTDSTAETADDHLAQCIFLEESGDKWRAGDAAKAARFYVRAIQAYDEGMAKFGGRGRGNGVDFDMAYNKYVCVNFSLHFLPFSSSSSYRPRGFFLCFVWRGKDPCTCVLLGWQPGHGVLDCYETFGVLLKEQRITLYDLHILQNPLCTVHPSTPRSLGMQLRRRRMM